MRYKLFLFLIFSTVIGLQIIYSQSQSTVVFELDLDQPASYFAMNGEDLEKNLNYEVEPGQNFNLNLQNIDTAKTSFYLVVNSSNQHKYKNVDQFTQTRTLKSKEKIKNMFLII